MRHFPFQDGGEEKKKSWFLRIVVEITEIS